MSLDWDRLPADMYVRKLVLREKSPYSSTQRLVCLAIADRMSRDDQDKWVAFMGLPDLAKRTGYSVKTISRSIDALKNSPEPLFRIYLGGVTRGIAHSCYGFELVRNPKAFAEARDRTRTERAATADAILGRGCGYLPWTMRLLGRQKNARASSPAWSRVGAVPAPSFFASSTAMQGKRSAPCESRGGG